MLNGIYQNASTMNGLESWNNAIAQNLAQSSNPGYKKATLSFEGEANGLIGYKGSFENTLFRETIAASGKDGVDFSAGGVHSTNIPTDFALESDGFFELKTPDGQLVYTRDGQFKINGEGELVSKQGYHVMSDARTVIQLTSKGGPLEGLSDGSLSQGGRPISVLGVRNVDDKSILLRSHGGFVIDPSLAVDAKSVDPDNIMVRHAALEESNVTSTKEMVDLIHVSRAFQLNQQVIRGRDELIGKAIQSLGGRA